MNQGYDEWILDHLRDFLPDNYLQLLYRYIFSQRAPFQILQRQAQRNVGWVAKMMLPLLQPILDRVTRALNDSPDVVVLGVLLIFIVLVFQVMIWVKRVMMWWTQLAFRIIFWAAVVGIIAMIWERGLEASLRDAFVLGGKIMGYAAVVKDIWLQEYRKYDAQTQQQATRGRRMGNR